MKWCTRGWGSAAMGSWGPATKATRQMTDRSSPVAVAEALSDVLDSIYDTAMTNRCEVDLDKSKLEEILHNAIFMIEGLAGLSRGGAEAEAEARSAIEEPRSALNWMQAQAKFAEPNKRTATSARHAQPKVDREDVGVRMREAIEDSLVTMVRKGDWIQPGYETRVRVDFRMLQEVFDSLDMDRVKARVTDRVEGLVADKIMNSMAAGVANDVKQIMSDKELRADIRATVREKIAAAVEATHQ
jgi:hypothetical protein